MRTGRGRKKGPPRLGHRRLVRPQREDRRNVLSPTRVCSHSLVVTEVIGQRSRGHTTPRVSTKTDETRGCLPSPPPLIALAADDPTDEADRRRVRGDHYTSGTGPPSVHQSAREGSNLASGRSGGHNESEAGTRVHKRSHGDARALESGVRVRDRELLSLHQLC